MGGGWGAKNKGEFAFQEGETDQNAGGGACIHVWARAAAAGGLRSCADDSLYDSRACHAPHERLECVHIVCLALLRPPLETAVDGVQHGMEQHILHGPVGQREIRWQHAAGRGCCKTIHGVGQVVTRAVLRAGHRACLLHISCSTGGVPSSQENRGMPFTVPTYERPVSVAGKGRWGDLKGFSASAGSNVCKSATLLLSRLEMRSFLPRSRPQSTVSPPCSRQQLV